MAKKVRYEKWISNALRVELILESKGKCHHCGLKASEAKINGKGLPALYDGKGRAFHIDHLIPQSKGGKTVMENLVVACRDCNLGQRRKVYANDERVKAFMQSINKKTK